MNRVIIATLIFLLLDGIWFFLLSKHIYLHEIHDLLRLSGDSVQPRWFAVVIVYVALIAGILLFVLPKANGNILHAFLYGAIFGLITYATYDFTNLAVLTKWTLTVSLIDVAWGMVVCGLTSGITLWICS